MNTIQEIATGLAGLEAEYSARLWIQYTTGLDQGVGESQKKINAYLKNATAFKVVCNALDSAKEPIAVREAKIMFQTFKDYHQSEKISKLIEKSQVLKNSLIDIVNKFRGVIDGKEADTTVIRKILNESDDAALRKKAYQSKIPLNKILVDAGFIQLLDLRKEIAAACGADDFVAYKLEKEDLTSDVFKTWRQDCKSRNDRYQSAATKLA